MRVSYKEKLEECEKKSAETHLQNLELYDALTNLRRALFNLSDFREPGKVDVKSSAYTNFVLACRRTDSLVASIGNGLHDEVGPVLVNGGKEAGTDTVEA